MASLWMQVVYHIESLTVGEIFISILDVLLIAYILYRLLLIIRGTRAIHLVQGILVLLFATMVSGWLNLSVVNWLLEQAQFSLLVAIPIVFQPELRRALEHVGRGRLFGPGIAFLERSDLEQLLKDLRRAIRMLARNKIGALIVIERESGLGDIIETGIPIDGRVSPEVLVNIFVPNTPLHDGAVILRGNRVAAAACFLPLTESPVDPKMGGRHRAALGITEQTDAVALVVSEENGAVSLARDGTLIRNLDEDNMQEMLEKLLSIDERSGVFSFLKNGGDTTE